MPSPQIRPLTTTGGYFKIFAKPPGGTRVDITFFRGAPTTIESMSSADPFGDATASLSFPQITGYDRPGYGDLTWLVPWTDIDIVWYGPDNLPTSWVWEGFMVSEEIGSPYSISCKGALYQADNYLAAPFYPQYPVPYEHLISRAFDTTWFPTHNSGLKINWPAGWKTVVPAQPKESYKWYLKPYGVTVGQRWTGLTTRNTGTWEPMLTGFVQTLLSVMYTDDGGQWTVVKQTGRVPVLQVRSVLLQPSSDTLVVYYGAPGVEVTMSRDFTQSANVVYGLGTDLHGTTYSNETVVASGQSAIYEPFAFLPGVHPARPSNPKYNPALTRKEVRLQFTQGMSQLDAAQTAQVHLQRFADPGFTGTINLQSDPLIGGFPYNKHLIRAGQTIQVKNFRGSDVIFHITNVTVSPAEGTAQLQVDSKFRDALTVSEVRARTRDALDPVNMLQVGKYSTTVQDSIKPWSYAGGSGVVPSGGGLDATKLFTQLMPQTEQFPWRDTVKKYPPSKYPSYYVHIGPRNASATNNWAGITRAGLNYVSIPVKMSQAGSIRLSQFAIYDKDGNVLPSRFHVSLYTSTVTRLDMPQIFTGAPGTAGLGYQVGQRYPFYQGAFERVKPDGTQQDKNEVLLPDGAGIVIGWGNYYEGAGYWPGTSSAGNPATGMLVDETPWSYDTTGQSGFDVYDAKSTQSDANAGILNLMFYCDGQGTKDVYLLGRLFRQEGT